MKYFTIVLVFAIASFTATAQTIRRVNADVTVTGTNVYNTIQAAHDAAVNGDVLIVEPGLTVGDLNCIKTLTIYGRGYFLAQNSNYSLLKNKSDNSKIGLVTFNASNSKIMGCEINRILINSGVSGITIQRNYIPGALCNGCSELSSIDFLANTASISNITISQNYCNSPIIIYANWCPNTVSNITISNNYFQNLDTNGTNPCISNVIVNQNTIFRAVNTSSIYNTAFTNNIFVLSANVTTSNTFNSTFNNNAYPSSSIFSPSVGTNNISVSNLTAQFANNTSSSDNIYKITNVSVLLTAGTSGGQIGREIAFKF